MGKTTPNLRQNAAPDVDAHADGYGRPGLLILPEMKPKSPMPTVMMGHKSGLSVQNTS
ncbi:MAG: hypothetical protein GDA39_00440 [Hyphomonadaceae bacterium]|nr:hypothetical protein [Hyphomonadaceae bacterium]